MHIHWSYKITFNVIDAAAVYADENAGLAMAVVTVGAPFEYPAPQENVFLL